MKIEAPSRLGIKFFPHHLVKNYTTPSEKRNRKIIHGKNIT